MPFQQNWYYSPWHNNKKKDIKFFTYVNTSILIFHKTITR